MSLFQKEHLRDLFHYCATSVCIMGTGLPYMYTLSRRTGMTQANPAELECHRLRVSLPTNKTDHSCMLIPQLRMPWENVCVYRQKMYILPQAWHGAWNFRNYKMFGHGAAWHSMAHWWAVTHSKHNVYSDINDLCHATGTGQAVKFCWHVLTHYKHGISS